jgi:hypothetical protein
MSVLAGGKTYGIAPNGDLFLVKTKTGIRDEFFDETGGIFMVGLQPGAVHWALERVKGHINNRLRADAEAKSVINMSWGK